MSETHLKLKSIFVQKICFFLFFWWVKLLGCDANHTPPSSAEVKNVWSFIFTHPYVFMVLSLIKQRLHLHIMVLSYAHRQLYLYNQITNRKVRTADFIFTCIHI